ncbi:MAG: ABC-2 family transporter protein [Synechococcales cyanobacterium T60_A2020_003]|nr:ABC-2 family transporter protein [Synechococcales cyanobacterium T60_A2020_003]
MLQWIRHPWKVARVLTSVYYAYMVEYRAELLFWMLSGSLPIILMGVWVQASQSGQFAFSSIEFVRYFLAVFIVRQFTVVWVIWEFERQVVEGTLSPKLLQPLDPGWHHFISHFAERFARLPFIVVLIGFFFVLYPQALWFPGVGTCLLFVLLLFLSFVLRFAIQYTLAMFSFWIERAVAIEQFWFLFYLFLSGLIAPIEIFPPVVQRIVLWTPFPYMIGFPASLLIGRPVNVVAGIAALVGWSAIFMVANRWLWRQGLKRYSGMGA